MQADSSTLHQQLILGCRQLGLQLSESIEQQLIEYVQLLHKWNKAYNLTAVRDSEQMVRRHLLDSLSILPWLKGQRCIDVGTGPGLPGMVLAIAEAGKRHWTLLDSNGKKTRFLRQAVTELGLENVEIIQERIEKFQPVEKFDTLTARAFAGLGDILQWSRHLVIDNHQHRGCILAMKGARHEVDRELDEIKPHLSQWLDESYRVKVEVLDVPGSEAERHLVIFESEV